MRCFIAIEIDPGVRAALAGVQSELRPHVQGVSWTKPDNIHLTLKFLGEIEERRAERVGRMLADIAPGLSGGTIESRGGGCFPNEGNPRVLWAGLEDVTGLLATASDAVEGALSKIGFPRERRPFRAHLTLGRVRQNFQGARLAELLSALAGRSFGTTSVRELTLFKSQLDPKGSIYTPLGRYLLC